MQVIFSLLFIIFSLIGIADASYISYEEAKGIIPPCAPGFDCASVLTSPYAKIGPFPLANLGVVYYLTVLVLAILHYLEIDLQKFSVFKINLLKRARPLDFLLLITTFGVAFSAYLVFLMAFVIQAWCFYCLISAATSTILFILVQLYNSKFGGHSSFLGKRLLLESIHTLYMAIAKPILFLFDPEFVHNNITKIGRVMGGISLVRFMTRWFLQFRHPILEKKIDGINFRNPVGLSAGYDYDGDLTQILSDVGFGWQTIGTVTYQPYAGNPKPRLGRFPNSKAILVNKGLKSIGAAAVIKKLSQLELKLPVGISIGSTNKHYDHDGEQVMDIIKCFLAFERSGLKHAYYELNISCPNTFGGEPFTTPDRLEVLLSALDQLKIKRPIYVKMPIDQSEQDTLQLFKVIADHHTHGVILGNLTKDKDNPAVLPEDRAEWKKQNGNLSGKPTFERSNNLISLAKKHYGDRFTIIGTGGIFTAQDAVEKINRGADLVQLITGMIFEGPPAIGRINAGLADYFLDKRADKVST